MSDPARHIPSSTFDLAVVGGGVHGLFAAHEAATAGARVVLLERDDFGAGLSTNHQRTVHGGLRTLQSGRIDRTLSQIADRRDWAVMAPHLLHPLAFVLPTRRSLTESRLAVGAALRIYNWLGRSRNDGLPNHLHLPAARLLSAEQLNESLPDMATPGATGGALWFDYQIRHPDRLNWLLALAAERAGVVLRNHVEVVAAIRENARIVGVQARDRLTGETVAVSARRVLVAAGGGIRDVHERLGLSGSPLLVRACNLLVDREAGEVAVAARGRSGRMLTATPWAGYWLVGTFQGDAAAPSGARAEPPTADVDAMVADANHAFPALALRRGDIRLIHAGLTPAVTRGGRVELMPESACVMHDTHVCSLIGVKYTTARSTARTALRRLGLLRAGRRGRRLDPPCLPYAEGEGAEQALAATTRETRLGLDDDVARHLVRWYGSEASDVLAFSAAANLAKRLTPGGSVLEGELLYAAEHCRAETLGDAVLRRTSLGAAGHPGPEAITRAADLLAAKFGWSASERRSQIEEVERRYSGSGSADPQMAG